jgi:hypothetical protein
VTPSDQNAQRPEGEAKPSWGKRISQAFWVLLTGMIIWFLAAVIIGRIVIAIFPPTDPMGPAPGIPIGSFESIRFGVGLMFETAHGKVPVGISFNWWDLPGTMIGGILAFMLVRSFWPRVRKS